MTTTQFEVDCALMAGASYISNRSEVNRFPAPKGWQAERYEQAPDGSGFEAISFRSTTNPNNIVISYAGTNFTERADWTEANIPLAFGLLARQLEQAADYYLQIKQTNPDATITLTGHSMGGGLASLIAVMFDEQAITFDQAPFYNSAWIFTETNPVSHEITTHSVAQALRGYLAGRVADTGLLAKLDAYLAAASPYNPDPNADDTFTGRTDNITNINVQDEALSHLSTLFFNRIGLQENIANSNVGATYVDLHSQALLAAFLQSDLGAAYGDHPQQILSEVTFQLPDLLKMIFDESLYSYKTDGSNTTAPNFLELIVNHQAGRDPRTNTAITADDMVTRFTADLWKLAQSGGMTMTDGSPSNAALNEVGKALIAFAMQKYYEESAGSPGYQKQLFQAITGGIRFDTTDVAADITTAKGYTQYLANYLGNAFVFTAEEQSLIRTAISATRDWYIQAGATGMNATDSNHRNALMLGGTGNDVLTGSRGNDLLLGNDNTDYLDGGAGDDLLLGGQGADILIGGTGNNILVGGQGDDVYYVTTGPGNRNKIVETREADGKIHGSLFIDGAFSGSLSATGAWKQDPHRTNTWVSAGDPNTILTHNSPWKIVTGDGSEIELGDFQDGDYGIRLIDGLTPTPAPTLVGDIKKRIETGGDADPGNDAYLVADDNYVTDGAEPGALDLISGTGGNDIILGLGGDDALSGLTGDDRIEGGDGSDILQGGLGQDTLIGGAGDDAIYGSSDDHIFKPRDVNFYRPPNPYLTPQGTGFNWTSGYDETYANGVPDGYHDAPRNRLAGDDGNTLDGGAGDDFIAAGTGADTAWGGTGLDQIWGMDGDDILMGESGNDLIHGDGNKESAISVVWTRPADHGRDLIDGGGGDDILYGQGNADTLLGGAGRDLLWGDDETAADTDPAVAGNDWLDGGAGDDQLIGGGKDDTLFGGEGDDTMWGDNADPSFTTDQDGDDTLHGGDGADTLVGGYGNDILGGNAGNDQLLGGQDNDLLEGGDGDDRLDGETGADTLMGGLGNDTLIGGAGNDTLDGGGGTNMLAGGAGDDTYLNVTTGDTIHDLEGQSRILLSRAGLAQSNAVTASATAPIIYIAQDNGDTIAIENAMLGMDARIEFADGGTIGLEALVSTRLEQSVGLRLTDSGGRLYGGNGNDRLYGGAGADTLAGYGGHDWIEGGQGNDRIDGGAGSDILGGGEGADRLEGGLGDDVISGGTGDDILLGGQGNDTLDGGTGNDTYRYGLGDGDDAIEAGAAAGDILELTTGGGLGDYSFMRLGNGDVLMRIHESGESLRLKGWFSQGANVGEIRFADGTAIDAATLSERTDGWYRGTSHDDTLIGTEGDDHLMGLAGNDTLVGGYGNDTLDGGAGVDTYQLAWGTGQDTVVDDFAEAGIVALGAGVDFGQVKAARVGDDLLLTLKGSQDSLRLGGYYAQGGDWQVRDADGNLRGIASLSVPPADLVGQVESWKETFLDAARDKLFGYVREQGYRPVGPDTYRKTTMTPLWNGGLLTESDTYRLRVEEELTDAASYRRQSAESEYASNSVTTTTRQIDMFSTGDMMPGRIIPIDEFMRLTGGNLTGYQPVYGYDAADPGTRILKGVVETTPATESVGAARDHIRSSHDDTTVLADLHGGNGDNTIYGKRSAYGRDEGIALIDGGAGNDSLYASGWIGRESGYLYDFETAPGGWLYGNEGDDRLYGAHFEDMLIGGNGDDVLDGRESADTYVILPDETGTDFVFDTGSPSTVTFKWDAPYYAAVETAYYASLGIADPDAWVGAGNVLPPLPKANEYAALQGVYAAGGLPQDTVHFGGGIRPEQLTFSWGEEGLASRHVKSATGHWSGFGVGYYDSITAHAMLDIGWGKSGSVRVVIPNATDLLGTGVERFAFDDGTVLTMAELLAMASPPTLDPQDRDNTLHGTADADTIEGWLGNDRLFGGDGNDTLDGGGGNDRLEGGEGSDTYLFGRGCGADAVIDRDGSGADVNVVQLTDGLAESDIVVTMADGYLTLGIAGTADSLSIRWDSAAGYGIQHVAFPDGTVWDVAMLEGKVSRAPALAVPVADQGATEDAFFEFTLPGGSFVDADAGDTLAYGATLANGDPLPAWLAFDPVTLRFSGVPGNGDVGTIAVRVTATDRAGLMASDEFDLAVANVNDAPVAAAGVPDQRAVDGTPFSVALPGSLFTDADAGDTLALVVTLADGNPLPAWLAFDAATRTLAGTPGPADIGGLDLRLLATDNAGAGAGIGFHLAIDAMPGISMTGSSGSDSLAGGSGADALDGGAGNDTVSGGHGDDILSGGTGADLLLGGQGNDTFLLSKDGAWVGGYSVRNNGSPGHAGSGHVIAIAGRVVSQDVMDGGEGWDTLLGTGGNDIIALDDGYSASPDGYRPRFVGVEVIRAGAGHDVVDLTSAVFSTGDMMVEGNDGNDVLWASSGNDLLVGGNGADRLDAGWGNDLMQGNSGNDTLNDTLGNNLFDGGAGTDTLTGGAGNELFIGGRGNDTLTTGTGHDVIAFNKGDGADILNASSGADNTLSLGGGIKYADLSLSRSGADLILKAGGSDRITLKGWYGSVSNHSVIDLQMIAEAMADFNASGIDPLRDDKVEHFDFAGIVADFDAAGAVAGWALTDARLSAHLDAGSDAAAMGGDLAWQYGKAGTLAGMGLNAAQGVISAAAFGQSAQTLNAPGTWSAELVKLG